VAVELVAAVEEPEQAVEAVALAGEPVVAPVQEVEQEPERVVVMGLELVQVRLQGPASARAQQPRSVLVLMRPSVPALALQLVRVRLAVPGLVPVPERPSVLALVVLSDMEPVMDPLTELGTKVPGLKMEPALERQSRDTDSAHSNAATGAGSFIVHTAPVFLLSV
jgi:hypothetical protein